MPYRTPEELRWKHAIERADFGVWDLDPKLELVHYSPQWKDRLGLAQLDMPDSTSLWRARVHPDDLDAMLRALRLHLDGYTDTYEMRFRLHSAGTGDRLVLSRGRVVDRDHRGEAVRMVGTMVLAGGVPARPAGATPALPDPAPGPLRIPLHRMLDAVDGGGLRDAPAAPEPRTAGSEAATRDRLLAEVSDLLDVAFRQGPAGS